MYFRKNDLEDLLNSLSLGEKRYVYEKLSIKEGADAPLYLQLFGSLVDPKSESVQFEHAISVQAHTNAKRRLYRHLLDCLHQYHQEKSAETIVHNLLCKVEILYDRGLPQQSAVLLEKARILALSNELFGSVFQILNWERRVNVHLEIPVKTAQEIMEDEQATIAKYNEIIELERIYSRIKEVKSRYGYARGMVKKELNAVITTNALLDKKFHPSSQRARHYYHLIYALYYHRVLDIKQAYVHSKELVISDMHRIPPEEYFEGIIEHIIYCMSLGYFSEMQDWLSFADAYIRRKGFSHSVPFADFIFYAQTCYSLIMYIYTGDLAGLQVAIKEAEHKLSIYEKRLSKERQLVIHGNLRNAYIAIGNIEQAERTTDYILSMDVQALRRDVVNDIFLGRAFFFLISGTYDLVSSAALSAYRQYQKVKDEDARNDLGLKIASILMKDYNFENPRIRASVLTEIRDSCIAHISVHKGLNNFHEGFTFFIIWSESIRDNLPFYIVAQSWYEDHLIQS